MYMEVGGDTSSQCGYFELPCKCKTVAGRNYPVLFHGCNNDNLRMVLVACSRVTINGSINNVSCSSSGSSRGSIDDITNFCNNLFVSDMGCDSSLFVTDFVVANSSSRLVVTCSIADSSSRSVVNCPSTDISSRSGVACPSADCSSSSRQSCDGRSRLDCVKNRRKCQMILHVPEVIIYAVFFCLLAGVCTASCKGEGKPSNCSLPDSSSPDVGVQASTVHNFSSGSLFIYPLNKTDLNSVSETDINPVSKTDYGGSKYNYSSHITGSTTEHTILQTGEGLAVLAESRFPAKETVGRPAYSSATNLPLTGQDEDKNFNKIVSMVVPFVCVLILAIVLCVSWILCRKYKCCHNKACLQKCSTFCNNCMSAPYVFQVQGNIKPQSQLSRDSTGLTLISPHPHMPQGHRSTGAVVHKPHRPNMSHKGLHSSSASVSRQSSSRSSHSVGYSPVRRQGSLHTHSARQSLGPARVIPQTVGLAPGGQQTS